MLLLTLSFIRSHTGRAAQSSHQRRRAMYGAGCYARFHLADRGEVQQNSWKSHAKLSPLQRHQGGYSEPIPMLLLPTRVKTSTYASTEVYYTLG